MITNVFYSDTQGERHIKTTLLGAAGMLGSPMLILAGIFFGFDNLSSNRIASLMGLLFVLSWICSAIGIRLTRATGEGVAAKILFLIQLLGLSLAASQQVQEIVFAHPEANGLVYSIADMAWPVSMLLMLIMEGFIIKAGIWRGWRRWSALLCGLALPVSMVMIWVSSRELGVTLFGVLTWLGFMMLGNAVRTSGREQSSDERLRVMR